MKLKKHEVWRKSFPHYKVQYYNKLSLVWNEVQKNFTSEQQASLYADTLAHKTRIVEVHRTWRKIL